MAINRTINIITGTTVGVASLRIVRIAISLTVMRAKTLL